MSLVLRSVSERFAIHPDELKRFIKTAPHRYKVYDIPKRNSTGQRRIANPAKELKFLQRFVVSKLLRGLPVHSSAAAYIKGKSIKNNAALHVHNNFLLKMDFKGFFPSIKPGDFVRHINCHLPGRFNAEDEELLCSILFWGPVGSSDLQLSIGAPSSPFISNTIMYPFDELISKYCREKEVVYSRYADDITFSTLRPNVLEDIKSKVSGILSELDYPTLSVNHAKTINTSKKHLRRVTGLVLTSDQKISLGRRKKREIHAMLFNFLKQADVEFSTDRQEFQNKLRGWLAFAKDVEPEFFESLKRKYGAPEVEGVFRQSHPEG